MIVHFVSLSLMFLVIFDILLGDEWSITPNFIARGMLFDKWATKVLNMGFDLWWARDTTTPRNHQTTQVGS
jgi:hypothetical protein